jgi:hypothetical protein
MVQTSLGGQVLAVLLLAALLSPAGAVAGALGAGEPTTLDDGATGTADRPRNETAPTAGVTDDGSEPAVAATDAADTPPVPLNSGDTHWIGQRLRVESTRGDDTNVTWTVRNVTSDGEVGGFVTGISLGADGSAVVDTEAQEMDGEYVVVDERGDVQQVVDGRARDADSVGEGAFWVERQSLSASLDDGDVERGDRPVVTFESNRASYTLNVTANVLDGPELADVFEEAEVVEQTEDYLHVRVRKVGGAPSEDMNISNVPSGYHRIHFTPVDSTAAATITFRLRGSIGQSTTASIEKEQFASARGDVVSLPVGMDRYSAATLVVGDEEEAGYEATMDLRDTDGDGTVTVLFNTSNAGESEAAAGEVDNEYVYRARGGEDTVQLTAETRLDSPIEAGDYPVDVTLNGSAAAVSILTLRPRESRDLVVSTAPRDADLDNRSALIEAATRRSTVARGDYLVAVVNANGLYGYVDDVEDLRANGIEVTIEQTNAPPNTEPATVDTGDGHLFVNPDAERLYLAFRLRGGQVDADQEFNVSFAVTDDNPFVPSGEGETVSAVAVVGERDVLVEGADGPRLVLPSQSGATVRGRTALAPGTELWVRLRTLDRRAPVNRQRTVAVSPDGRIRATFNLSGIEDGTELELTVGEGTTTYATVSDVVVRAERTPTPTSTPAPTPTPTPSPTPTPTPSPTPTSTPSPTPTPVPNDTGPTATATSPQVPAVDDPLGAFGTAFAFVLGLACAAGLAALIR